MLSWLLVNIKSTEEMRLLLQDLMTPQEIVEVGERIQIIKHLKAKLTQRKVAETMGISVTTVNRGARVLKFGTGAAEKHIKA